MRRGLWVSMAALCVGATVVTVTAMPPDGGIAYGDEPATTTTTAPPADAASTGVRGTVVQLTPTLPPPPTTQPPPPPFADNPELPWFSGDGRRVVYSIGRMRVWIVDGSNTVIRTYRVSGHKYRSQPSYGTYRVFSRSAYTCNIEHTYVCMRYMVRFTVGPGGDNIGFHEIPNDNGRPVQTEAQLGQARSAGCVRQGTADAQFMWNWAYKGTVVVVVP